MKNKIQVSHLFPVKQLLSGPPHTSRMLNNSCDLSATYSLLCSSVAARLPVAFLPAALRTCTRSDFSSTRTTSGPSSTQHPLLSSRSSSKITLHRQQQKCSEKPGGETSEEPGCAAATESVDHQKKIQFLCF